MLLCPRQRLHHELADELALVGGRRLHEERHGAVADAGDLAQHSLGHIGPLGVHDQSVQHLAEEGGEEVRVLLEAILVDYLRQLFERLASSLADARLIQYGLLQPWDGLLSELLVAKQLNVVLGQAAKEPAEDLADFLRLVLEHRQHRGHRLEDSVLELILWCALGDATKCHESGVAVPPVR